MRAVTRWLRRARAEHRLRNRRHELRQALEADLGYRCQLIAAGARGRDSVYYVQRNGETVACMRVVNPHLKRKPLAANMPFQVLDDSDRLQREWQCYQRGAATRLTPRPLWRAPDAIACEYVPGERLMYGLLAEPNRFWSFICAGTRAVARLHELGITHMDVSLANLIQTPDDEHVFIDFEYGPAPGLNPAQQRAYDHLRLVESTIKFLPATLDGYGEEWIQTLIQLLDDECRDCSLAPLRPALERLLSHPHLAPALAQVFTHSETFAPQPDE